MILLFQCLHFLKFLAGSFDKLFEVRAQVIHLCFICSTGMVLLLLYFVLVSNISCLDALALL